MPIDFTNVKAALLAAIAVLVLLALQGCQRPAICEIVATSAEYQMYASWLLTGDVCDAIVKSKHNTDMVWMLGGWTSQCIHIDPPTFMQRPNFKLNFVQMDLFLCAPMEPTK